MKSEEHYLGISQKPNLLIKLFSLIILCSLSTLMSVKIDMVSKPRKWVKELKYHVTKEGNEELITTHTWIEVRQLHRKVIFIFIFSKSRRKMT